PTKRTGIMSLALIIAAAVAAAFAAPSKALTFVSASGRPGLVSPLQYTFCIQRDLSGNPDRLYPESVQVGPSPAYPLPQTVVENVRVDYSTDGGVTWYVWKWVQTAPVSITSTSGVR